MELMKQFNNKMLDVTIGLITHKRATLKISFSETEVALGFQMTYHWDWNENHSVFRVQTCVEHTQCSNSLYTLSVCIPSWAGKT